MKCIWCGKEIKEEDAYGDGVCEECIKEGRPPFRG